MSDNQFENKLFIVTVCLNSARTIYDTLESVANQGVKPERYIIVDGGSTDGTLNIVESFREKFESGFVVISEPDGGIYQAMNKGITEALGYANPTDLIGMINSDDAYISEAFRTISSEATLRPEVGIFYADSLLMNVFGEPLNQVRKSVPILTKESASNGMPIEHPSMFVRVKVYREIGLYDESYKIAGDYELLLRAIDRHVPSFYIPSPLVRFRIGGVSTTQEITSYKEAIRARLAYGSNLFYEWGLYYKRRLFGYLYRLIFRNKSQSKC